MNEKEPYRLFYIAPSLRKEPLELQAKRELVFDVIRKACDSFEYPLELVRAEQQIRAMDLSSNIQESIKSSDMVIAELSERNQNVYFEAGLAMALNKPQILITQSPDIIPSNLSRLLYIQYTLDKGGLEYLGDKLRSAFRAVVQEVERNKVQQLSSPEFFVNAYLDTPIKQIGHLITDAQNEITILTSSLAFHTNYLLAPLIELSRKNRNVSIRVACLDPESHVANIKSSLLGLNIAIYRTELRKSIFKMLDAISQFANGAEIRLYDTLPIQEFITIDDTVFFMLPSYSSRSKNSLTINLSQKRTKVKEIFTENFYTIWEEASPIPDISGS